MENNSNVKIVKSACRMCHGGCGILIHLKDDKVVKVTGDKESPINKGRLCVKGVNSLERLYSEDRIKYPMKRVGKRGEGKWERISWEEAYTTICNNIEKTKKEFGAESIVIGQGTGRSHFHFTVRFAHALGTPNWMEPGCAQCFFPRVALSSMTYGSLIGADYYSEKQPGLILIWGHNPFVCSGDGESQFSVRDAYKKGSKIICIDPRETESAKKAELWLKIRPGTDTALALAIINIIIKENLYDEDFIKGFTYGFDELKERVKDNTAKWASEITLIPEEDIIKAARMIATIKPMALEWGVALEQNRNTTQTVRSVALIPALTGNVDNEGGSIINNRIVPDVDHFEHAIKIPDENGVTQASKRLGIKDHRVLCNEENGFAAHIPSVFNAIRTGKPYPVKTFLMFGSNALISYGNTKDVKETFENIDFISAMDFFMTPTMQMADIILPAASHFEHDSLSYFPHESSHTCIVQQGVTRIGEAKSDPEVYVEICKRLGVDYGGDSVMEILDYQQVRKIEELHPQFKGLTFDKLRELGSVHIKSEYHKYLKNGFDTPTGKVELYSTILESLGYDPLPYYREPAESPISDPETFADYPLILITGGREKEYFLSENHHLPFSRRSNKYPTVEIHPKTAKKYGVEHDKWIYIETKRGRITQKLKVTEGILEDVINCQHGFYYPEEIDKDPMMGYLKSNCNVLTNNKPPFDEGVGTYQLRSLLCKIYPNNDMSCE